MTYAIDTILRLCEENTRLKCGLPATLNTEDTPKTEQELFNALAERLVKGEITATQATENFKVKKNVKFGDFNDETWATLQNIDTAVIKQYLAEECCFHIYNTPPPTVLEVEALKVSADLICEAQQKQINLMIDDQRERMDDRQRLLKQIERLEEALRDCGVSAHPAFTEEAPPLKIGAIVKGPKGRPPKLSPCMSDPQLIYEHPHQ